MHLSRFLLRNTLSGNSNLFLANMNQRLFASGAVSPKLVKQLRALTGSPLKDCMKTLEETKGDIEQAKELLRQRGLADAEKRLGRETSEGYVGMKVDKQNKLLTMIELHCETDFVAKTDMFKDGLERVVETLHGIEGFEMGMKDMSDVDKIAQITRDFKLKTPLDADLKEQTIEDGLKYIISKTQENCKLARIY